MKAERALAWLAALRAVDAMLLGMCDVTRRVRGSSSTESTTGAVQGAEAGDSGRSAASLDTTSGSEAEEEAEEEEEERERPAATEPVTEADTLRGGCGCGSTFASTDTKV